MINKIFLRIRDLFAAYLLNNINNSRFSCSFLRFLSWRFLMKVSFLTFQFFARCFYLFHMNIFIENLFDDALSSSSKVNSLNSSEFDVIFSFVKISHVRVLSSIEDSTNSEFLIRSDFKFIVVSLSFNEIEVLFELYVFVSHLNRFHSKTFIFFWLKFVLFFMIDIMMNWFFYFHLDSLVSWKVVDDVQELMNSISYFRFREFCFILTWHFLHHFLIVIINFSTSIEIFRDRLILMYCHFSFKINECFRQEAREIFIRFLLFDNIMIHFLLRKIKNSQFNLILMCFFSICAHFQDILARLFFIILRRLLLLS